jgi:methylthioxylose transferase
MPRGFLWISAIASWAVALVGSAWIAIEGPPIGSPEGGWFYGYVAGFSAASLWRFALACALNAAAVAAAWPWLKRLSSTENGIRFSELAVISAWCVLAAFIQALLLSLSAHELGAKFASDTSNSFYSVALRFDADSILGDFERLRPRWPLHAHSNLPGKLLLVRALTRISSRADVVAWLVVVLSNLGGVLVYVFVRDVFKQRMVAALSAMLYLFTPARLFFFPLLNTITPVVVFACGCLLTRWIATGRIAYAAALGAAVYALILFEPTALVIGVLFAALLGRAIVSKQIARSVALSQIAVGIVGFAATHLFMMWWFGFDLFSALRQVWIDANAFNVEARRPYGIWLRQNIVDFFFGAGLAQAVLFVAALADGMADLQSERPGRDAMTIVITCSAGAAAVAVADVSGINRGEVLRLWIFLACVWQIPAAYVCARLQSALAFTVLLVTTLLQVSLGMSMIGFIVP